MPKPFGREVQVTMYVYAEHAGILISLQQKLGVLIYVNFLQTIWYSKIQNTVESSTFGSEFISQCNVMKLVKYMCYKLRMMGSLLETVPTDVWANNYIIVKNTSTPESILRNKHVAILYHNKYEYNRANFSTKNLNRYKLWPEIQQTLFCITSSYKKVIPPLVDID